jgi:hypothetical protein
MMRWIEYLYFNFRKFQSTSTKGDTVFFPLLMVAVMLQPVTDSILRIVLSLPQQWHVFNKAESNFYTRVDRWFYLSVAITYGVCIIFLSMRSKEIDLKFESIKNDVVKKDRFLLIFLWLLSVAALNFVNFRNYFLTMPIFVVMALPFYFLMKKRIGQHKVGLNS